MPTMKKPTLKQQVKQLINRLPDTCTAEDIQYQLYLLDKIRRGEDGLERGGMRHDEVRKRAAGWEAVPAPPWQVMNPVEGA